MVEIQLPNEVRICGKCNNKCAFCSLDSENPNLDKVFERIDEISNRHACNDIISLTGGEVLLNKDFPIIIKHCKSKEFNEIIIDSNGRIFSTLKNLNAAIKMGVTGVRICLTSDSEEEYNVATNTDSFNQMCMGLANLKDSSLKLSGVICIKNIDYGASKKLVDFGNKYGINSFEISADVIESFKGLKKEIIEMSKLIRYCRDNDIMLDIDKTRLHSIMMDKVVVGPDEINIHITSRCNAACHYCWYHSPLIKDKPELPVKEASYEKISEILDAAYTLGARKLFISGKGEPLVHKEIAKILALANELKFYTILATNGILLYQYLDFLAKWNIDNLYLNVSAFTENGYDSLHSDGVSKKDDFNSIFDAIKRIKFDKKNNDSDYNPFITLVYLMTKKNYKDISLVNNVLNDLPLDRIYFKFMDYTESTKVIAMDENDFVELKEMIGKLLDSDQSRTLQIRTNLHDVYEKLSEKLESGSERVAKCDSTKCFNGWSYIKFTLAGDALPCCDFPDTPSLGNIYQQSFQEIWYGDKFHKIRLAGKKYLWDHCSKCYHDTENKAISVHIAMTKIKK